MTNTVLIDSILYHQISARRSKSVDGDIIASLIGESGFLRLPIKVVPSGQKRITWLFPLESGDQGLFSDRLGTAETFSDFI